MTVNGKQHDIILLLFSLLTAGLLSFLQVRTPCALFVAATGLDGGARRCRPAATRCRSPATAILPADPAAACLLNCVYLPLLALLTVLDFLKPLSACSLCTRLSSVARPGSHPSTLPLTPPPLPHHPPGRHGSPTAVATVAQRQHAVTCQLVNTYHGHVR